MATMNVKDADGLTEVIEKPLAPGRAAAAASGPAALSNEDLAALQALGTQTTSAAILAKIIAAPATEAKQEALGVVATQTTAAAILAKIITAPATEAKQDTQVTALGIVTETAPATDTASSGLNGRLQRIAQRLTTLLVPGAGTAAAALRTTLASDDPAVATLGATTGAAVITDANGTVQQYLRGLVTRWANALGAGTAAAALRTTTASDSPVIALYGAVTETAPATDTASSGLNGRLQRIAQRLTTLLVPGAGTAATALRTTLASDDPLVATAGSTVGAAVITDTSGTLQGYLRGAIVLALATNTKLDAAVASLAFLDDYGNGEYETVAASQTNQALGATGATGDFLVGLWLVPTSVSPGAVTVKDGADGAITVFAGGTNSVQTLHGFEVPLALRSRTGAWQVTTGAAISVVAKGNFT